MEIQARPSVNTAPVTRESRQTGWRVAVAGLLPGRARMLAGAHRAASALASFKPSLASRCSLAPSRERRTSPAASAMSTPQASSGNEASRATQPHHASRGPDPLPTSGDLIAELGEPDADLSLFGNTAVTRDTAYKQTLAALDAYHRAAADPAAAGLEGSRKLRATLQEVHASLKGCVAGKSGAAGAAAGRQLVQVGRELAILDRVIARAAADAPGTDLCAARALQRQEAAQVFALADTPASAFSEQHVQAAVRQGLTRQLAQECITRSPGHDPAMTPLGSGGINTVFRMQIKLAGQTKGTEGVYKKERDTELNEVELNAGISPGHPSSSLRNVATYKLNQRLKLDVIAPTHLVLNGDELGCVMERARGVSPMHTGNLKVTVNAQVARRMRADPTLLADYAKASGFKDATIKGDQVTLVNEVTVPLGDGTEFHNDYELQHAIDFRDSDLRRQLTQLQFLDCLTGQCDRHAHNYFVDPATRRVTGIDNDMAFGCGDRLNDPNALPGQHAARLPNVIDRATAQALLGMTRKDLDSACEGLSREEIDATEARLTVLQAHLRTFGEDQLLGPGADWSSPAVSEKLGVSTALRDSSHAATRADPKAFARQREADSKTSYVARETASRIEVEKGFMAMPVFEPAQLERLSRETLDRAALAKAMTDQMHALTREANEPPAKGPQP